MRFADILMVAAAAPSGIDPDALLWRDAVVANGGSVSLARLIIVSQFITAEKASGAWPLTDDYGALWAENAAQALTSLKQRRLAVATNSPVFTADRSYAFDGAASYVDTGFVPSTHAVAMSVSSTHFELYERTELNSNTYAGGVVNTASRAITIRPRIAGNASLGANSAPGNFTLPVVSSLGLTQTWRNGPLVTDVYGAKNGVDMVRSTDPTGVGASLSANSITLGGYNNAGTAAGFRASSLGFWSIGAALSGAQRLARYNAVQAWATAVGAQV